MSFGRQLMTRIDYKSSGVNIEKGYETVKMITEPVKRTHGSEVLGSIGGFGGLFQPNLSGIETPVLVSGTDGVGTKLKIAFALDKHDSIGQDLVAMCVNDVLCVGAKPLFFLDYIATGELRPKQIAAIVDGIARACQETGTALIGGETAEMPGFYAKGEYDVAGFTVGIVDKSLMISGDNVQEGDIILGLPSSGFHSNGFSLLRKVIAESEYGDDFNGRTWGDILLTPTKLYVAAVQTLLQKYPNAISGMAHITGGGFIENIPRAYSQEFSATIDTSQWKVPEPFLEIQRRTSLNNDEMFNTFNMGIGYIILVNKHYINELEGILKDIGEISFRIGEMTLKNENNESICFV